MYKKSNIKKNIQVVISPKKFCSTFDIISDKIYDMILGYPLLIANCRMKMKIRLHKYFLITFRLL